MTDIPPAFRNGRFIVTLTAALCLILLAIVLKNVLHVPATQLSSDMILYIILYTGFIVSFQFTDNALSISSTQTKIWTAVSILMTLGIIAVYAI
jgi:hypothetical protein